MTWGNNNKGPWGKAPNPEPSGGGGRNNDNDIDEFIRKSQDRMRGMFGGGGDRKFIFIGILIIGLLWLASGIYRVNPDELGVVLRFGKYDRFTTPGLNYHLPYPIETVLIPSVTRVNKVEVGFRASLGDRSGQNGRSFEKESLMLTGDRNIVDIDFEVQWKIDATNPQDYLFNVRDPAASVKPVAESAMREVIGRNSLDEILTTAQSEVADETKRIMQEMLNDYEAGIEIIAVNLSKPDVPAPVIDEFQDVKRAEQDKETAESVAEGYRNEIIPRAKGSAEQMKQEALAYKNRVIADAEGDVARFLSVYEEYRLAKDVTKKRIYLETMEEIMNGMQKVVIDSESGNGVLPYLPLQELQSKRGAN